MPSWIPQDRRLGSIFYITLIWGGIILLYWGGLTGTVILDDRHIVEGLRALSSNSSLSDYLLKGVGELNRPVAYLTYYWQRDQVEPTLSSFKEFNLILHLLNSLLVFLLFDRLLKLTRYERYRLLLAFAATSIWALSPLQVSTVLYMVQRMTELSAMFVLLALLCWICGRSPNTSKISRYVWLYAGFGLFMLLGLFSKESAITGCVMVLVIDATFFAKTPKDRMYTIWRWLAIILPLLILTIYFVVRWNSIVVYGGREFTLDERLLTQPRVLFDYVSKFIAPRWGGYGLFYNDYPYSKSLFDPLTTFFSIAGLLAATGFAIWKRNSWAVVSFAVLFFLAGHLIESTFIPLELYFEHRNYLPTVSLALLLPIGVYEILKRVSGKFKIIVLFACGLWFIGMLAVSRNEVRLWGAPLEQAIHWYQQHPDSHRAHSHIGELMFNIGLYNESANFYQETIGRFPNDPSKILLWWELGCSANVNIRPTMGQVQNVLRNGDHYRETISVFKAMLTLFESGKCQAISLDDFLSAAQALIENPLYKKHERSLLVLSSRIYELKGDERRALEYLKRAAEKYGTLDTLMAVSQRYYYLGLNEKADLYLLQVEAICRDSPSKCWAYQKSIQLLRKQRDTAKRE
ncbi:tetratricopeptide repeat protein [Aestuariirhabdus sp. LZHN29]|uniref:tetratricopeptide repeat protein n=1 Tax=Aestuariirhabdus sp. LZHN29 TaxID=3417462 RepID=UPI003CF21880